MVFAFSFLWFCVFFVWFLEGNVMKTCFSDLLFSLYVCETVCYLEWFWNKPHFWSSGEQRCFWAASTIQSILRVLVTFSWELARKRFYCYLYTVALKAVHYDGRVADWTKLIERNKWGQIIFFSTSCPFNVSFTLLICLLVFRWCKYYEAKHRLIKWIIIN